MKTMRNNSFRFKKAIVGSQREYCTVMTLAGLNKILFECFRTLQTARMYKNRMLIFIIYIKRVPGIM